LQHHISLDDFEALALGHHLGSVKQAEVEAHLLICTSCRDQLVREDLITESVRAAFTASIARHATRDGIVQLWLEQTSDGWVGKIESAVVRSRIPRREREEALTSIEQAFRDMFPEHVCDGDCAFDAEQ
jgi:anti-sigma factor ChrR (cupin superfamily)